MVATQELGFGPARPQNSSGIRFVYPNFDALDFAEPDLPRDNICGWAAQGEPIFRRTK